MSTFMRNGVLCVPKDRHTVDWAKRQGTASQGDFGKNGRLTRYNGNPNRIQATYRPLKKRGGK